MRIGLQLGARSVFTLIVGAQALLFIAGCGDAQHGSATSAPRSAASAPLHFERNAEFAGNTEIYERVPENPVVAVSDQPLSTFSIDVDTASYTNVRRYLNSGQVPPPDAVRIEEFINYFRYNYPAPEGEQPIAITAEVSECPWNAENRLVRIGLQGRRMDPRELPPRNLVFLIDVSGSMAPPNRLPLVKESLRLLTGQLGARDRVAIVVYAGSSGLVLPPTPGSDRNRILSALDRLQAGGSTNGGQGIQLAYRVADQSFQPNAVNRVILATDGDFNVGMTSQGDLLRLIEEKRRSGIYLTVLGYGMGNLKDATLEKLADHGNGHYAYIDTLDEARKVFVEEGAALVTIAKDVKVQVEFNPLRVAAYRQLGYENRQLRAQDFKNDQKDAGDMGAGHSVTALYEIIPPGKSVHIGGTDLKYQRPRPVASAAGSPELLTVKVRYKEPTEEASRQLAQPVLDGGATLDQASADFRFATAVAAFGMLLREKAEDGGASFNLVRRLAADALGADEGGYRAEFLKLVEVAEHAELKRSAVSQSRGKQ